MKEEKEISITFFPLASFGCEWWNVVIVVGHTYTHNHKTLLACQKRGGKNLHIACECVAGMVKECVWH